MKFLLINFTNNVQFFISLFSKKMLLLLPCHAETLTQIFVIFSYFSQMMVLSIELILSIELVL